MKNAAGGEQFSSVADKERAEYIRRLQESEERFRLMADASPVLLWMSGRSEGCTFFNKAWLEFTSRSMDEILGDGWMIDVHPEDIEHCTRVYSESCKSEKTLKMSYRLRRHDGVYRWILDYGTPRFDAAGQFTGYVGSCVDITELLDAEEKQRKLADQQRFLSEATALLYSSLDYEKILQRLADLAVPKLADWCVVVMNGAEGVLNTVAIAHLDPEMVDWAKSIAGGLTAGIGVKDGVEKVLRSGRAMLYPQLPLETAPTISITSGIQSVMIVPLRSVSRTVGAMVFASTRLGHQYSKNELCFAEDLAARAAMAIENSILYRDLQKADEAKTNFISIVSHELRTPLNVMNGWIELLRHGAVAQEEMSWIFETLHRNVKVQTKLIEDLLDMSRIMAGKLTLSVEELSMEKIVQQIVDTLYLAASNKNITVDVRVDAGAHVVMGDPERISQVIWNLLSNAIKFSGNGGSVIVYVNQVGSSMEVMVQDFGCGISPHFLPFVFERFRQEDSSTTRQHGGLGLGLAIVRHIVELHGGNVEAFSDGLGKGSRFVARFPIQKPGNRKSLAVKSDAVETVEPQPKCDLKNMRILVVDDDLDSLQLALSVLERAGAQVLSVDTASKVLDMLSAFRPDILISDIAMPGVDGYQLIHSLRDKRQFRNLLAIALTAFADEAHRQASIERGFDLHITKPFNPELLVESIADALTKKNLQYFI